MVLERNISVGINETLIIKHADHGHQHHVIKPVVPLGAVSNSPIRKRRKKTGRRKPLCQPKAFCDIIVSNSVTNNEKQKENLNNEEVPCSPTKVGGIKSGGVTFASSIKSSSQKMVSSPRNSKISSDASDTRFRHRTSPRFHNHAIPNYSSTPTKVKQLKWDTGLTRNGFHIVNDRNHLHDKIHTDLVGLEANPDCDVSCFGKHVSPKKATKSSESPDIKLSNNNVGECNSMPCTRTPPKERLRRPSGDTFTKSNHSHEEMPSSRNNRRDKLHRMSNESFTKSDDVIYDNPQKTDSCNRYEDRCSSDSVLTQTFLSTSTGDQTYRSYSCFTGKRAYSCIQYDSIIEDDTSRKVPKLRIRMHRNVDVEDQSTSGDSDCMLFPLDGPFYPLEKHKKVKQQPMHSGVSDCDESSSPPHIAPNHFYPPSDVKKSRPKTLKILIGGSNAIDIPIPVS